VDVAEAVGLPPPLFVHPNHGDHDYALAKLDAASLEFALERLPDLPDPLLRQQVWSTLWEMVRSASLRSTDYLEAVRQFAPRETDRALVQSIVDRAKVAQRRYLPASAQAHIVEQLTRSAIGALRTAADPDLQLVWARTAAALAADDDTIAELLALVDGRWSVEGFEPDQQLRWAMATKAVAHDLDGAHDRVQVERERDGSDRGERAVIQAEVSQPDAAVKHQAWTRINGAGYGSDYNTRAALAGFQWSHQRALTLPFREPFYEHLPQVYRERDHAYAESYLRWLVPDLWAEPVELERIRSVAGSLEDDQGLLRRHLTEIADDVERDIRVREFALAEPAAV
jgi:aminopeptidase N